MKALNFEKVAHEWSPCQEKTFSISVRCWLMESSFGDKYVWNVYAHIYEGHPLFSDVERAKNLHFHYGCTYDKFVTVEHPEPEATRAAWMKTSRSLKVGSDYSHYQDDVFEASAPHDGVPFAIQRDVLELAAQLSAAVPAPAEEVAL